MPATIAFDYEVENLRLLDEDQATVGAQIDRNAARAGNLQKQMNARGRAGWRLVDITYDEIWSTAMLVWERAHDSANDQRSAALNANLR